MAGRPTVWSGETWQDRTGLGQVGHRSVRQGSARLGLVGHDRAWLGAVVPAPGERALDVVGVPPEGGPLGAAVHGGTTLNGRR